MKNLRKFLVFVLFALATVFAFGMNGVKAAEEEVARFEFGENDPSITSEGNAQDGKDAGTSYSETTGNYTLELTDLTKVYKGAYDAKGNSCIKLGTSNLTGSFKFTVPNDIVKVGILVAGYKNSTVSVQVNGGATQSITTKSANGEFTEVFVDTKSNKNVTFATSTGKRCKINTIIFYATPVDSDAVELEAPTNVTLTENTLSWNAVENATSYTVYFGSKVVKENAVSPYTINETDLKAAGIAPTGNYTVSVKAIGDKENYLDSAATNATSQYNYLHTFVYDTEFEYQTYEELVELTPANNAKSEECYVARVYVKEVYQASYGNCYVIDENGDEFVVYGMYHGFVRYNSFAEKPQAGDEIVIKGVIQDYSGQFEFVDAQLLQLNDKVLDEPEFGLGYQISKTATNNAKHIRFIAGLNIDYNELEALSFTITDASDPSKTRTIEITNVFGALTASSSDATVSVISAESKGYECFFAVTITNVTVGKGLTVTATYTTSTGTYTTEAKTVTVSN